MSKKPLTKEEFLDKQNSKIHKELLSVFAYRSNGEAISRWFRDFQKDNPKLGLCQFMGQPKVNLKVTLHHDAVFINMCEALQNGTLVVKEDMCEDCLYEDVGGTLFIARVCRKHNKLASIYNRGQEPNLNFNVNLI